MEFLRAMDALPAVVGFASPFIALTFVAFGYFMITLDRSRAGSTSKDDTQVGIKLVLHGLILMGVMMAAGGVTEIAAYVFSGFKGGSGPIKHAVAPIAIGALTIVLAAKAFLPRTNNSSNHQAERFMLGALAIIYAGFMLLALDQFIDGLINDRPWEANSGAFASGLVSAAVALLGIFRLGSISGWVAPAPPPAPPPQQHSGGMPQGGGYPPQGGGYPPQGGGYPPQGGGYPPQGGGGYPPQGGGGYPPQGGGGYPPQGGGYGR